MNRYRLSQQNGGLARWIGTWLLCSAPSIVAANDLDVLMPLCAPSVHPATMARIIRVESRGHPYAIADAGLEGLPWSVRKLMVKSHFPDTQDAAVALAQTLLNAGHVVSVGLTQVSSRNLGRLGLSVREALEPCTNLRAGGQILTEFYVAAFARHGDSQKALVAAISAYNTGDFVAGVLNGYVGQVMADPPPGGGRIARRKQ